MIAGVLLNVKRCSGGGRRAALPELLKTPPIFDGRNQYSPPAMKSMDFEYAGIEMCRGC